MDIQTGVRGRTSRLVSERGIFRLVLEGGYPGCCQREDIQAGVREGDIKMD